MKYMMARMEKLERGLGQTQQAMINAFGITNTHANLHLKVGYVLHVTNFVGIAYLIGHSFGWW